MIATLLALPATVVQALPEEAVGLAAEAATYYVQYRACGQLADAYEQEAASMAETARATESLVRAGLSPGNDAALA